MNEPVSLLLVAVAMALIAAAMKRAPRMALALALVFAGGSVGCSGEPRAAAARDGHRAGETALPASIRLATFNIREMSTEALLDVDENGAGRGASLLAAAEIVSRVQPDVLVIQEIDHDYTAPADLALNARRFRDSYLRRLLGEGAFPYVFAAPCNTGIPSGYDLNGDGRAAGPEDSGSREFGEDCFGFGRYPGQYSMAVLSRFPLDASDARTFRQLLWKDLPENHLPEEFYGAAADDLRLSSKSHWDLPVRIGGRTLRLWISHPTPPVFDGEEDRNGRRNFDEIAFWVAYLDGEPTLYDDQGGRGGYSPDASFVILGDLNSDPRGDGAFYDGRQSIDLLLSDPRLQDLGGLLVSDGAVEAFGGDPAAATVTADFGGGMRVDYLIPSAGIEVVGGGVFWPAEGSDPAGHRLALTASDHRLVWVDLDPRSFR